MSANRRLAKKVLTYDELAQLIENDEDMDAFLPPLDNNEDTDVESENEEEFPQSQLLVESNRNVKSNLNDEIENENDNCKIPKLTDDIHDHSILELELLDEVDEPDEEDDPDEEDEDDDPDEELRDLICCGILCNFEHWINQRLAAWLMKIAA
ncbi:unnamed protein product [Diabrotica balteata]|uniref:Uncharacterized protein n=1 Tax=Diabrotica balteata TaxID=107213 RepID=A0A9N9SUZ4_DIABA|nr:unnamed protein product [Diabrotica balteata]